MDKNINHEEFGIEFKELHFSNCIIEIISKEVRKLSRKHWKKDKCKPKFLISILYDIDIRNNDEKHNQYIILNCTHLGQTFSKVLFPIIDQFYGYDGLLEVMNSLYNQTM